MRMVRKFICIFIALIPGVFSPLLVYAGCGQSDLTGTWITYALSVDSSGLAYSPQTNRCKVKINSSGSIVTSKSGCFIRNWTGINYVNITGGKFSVSSSCKLSGSIVLGVLDEIIIDYGTLSKDKHTFSLIGFNEAYQDYITHLNGVKK